ncbi:putative tail fiber protein, partial [Escherichia coli 96.0932]
MVRSSPD